MTPRPESFTPAVHIIPPLPGYQFLDSIRYTYVVEWHLFTAGIATIHVSHDLSEERAVRTQLVSNDRLATIGRLAAGVAHEVNNPAGFITLALQLLKDQLSRGKTPTVETVSIVDEAITAMLQINQIMRDLTGFTRERARSITDLTLVANSASFSVSRSP